MYIWGYTIDTTLEWVAFIIFLILALALYFSIVWFIQKFATGMLGGFILIATGMGLVLGPAFHLIRVDASVPEMLVSIAAIFAGCVTVLVGTFSIRDYDDF